MAWIQLSKIRFYASLSFICAIRFYSLLIRVNFFGFDKKSPISSALIINGYMLTKAARLLPDCNVIGKEGTVTLQFWNPAGAKKQVVYMLESFPGKV